MTIISTLSGKHIDLVRPATHAINIRDIAHHLALINRFCGATHLPYCVAQHSTVVSKIAEQVDDDPLIALQALLHDTPEYVTGDITTPMQQALGTGRTLFKIVEERVLITIYSALGVPLPSSKAAQTIGYADRQAFATEWRDMMTGQCPEDYCKPANFAVKPIPWHAAEQKFLKEFGRLSMLAGIVAPKNPPFNPTMVHIK
jgi:5'-deoxynucleotidase YfbR-like HD superfamily hydrolase